MSQFEIVITIVGFLFGACYPVWRLSILAISDRTIVAAYTIAHSDSERIGAFFVSVFSFGLLYFFGSELLSAGVDDLTSDQQGRRYFLLPMFVGAMTWFPLVVLIDNHARKLSALSVGRASETSSDQDVPAQSSDNEALPAVARQRYKIDGNNIAMMRSTDFDLGLVASLAQFLIAEGGEVQVFFDANVGMKATDGRTHLEAGVVARMLNLADDSVTIVPSGTRADDWLLLSADEDEGVIISNDRFRGYEAEFPFLNDSMRRLSVAQEGRRYRVMGFRRSFVAAPLEGSSV